MWNVLHKQTEISFFRNHQNDLKEYFPQGNDLVVCNDLCSLLNAVGHQHDPTEWRLFIDSSKVSLKAVLLHKGNEFPSVPLALAANGRL